MFEPAETATDQGRKAPQPRIAAPRRFADVFQHALLQRRAQLPALETEQSDGPAHRAGLAVSFG